MGTYDLGKENLRLRAHRRRRFFRLRWHRGCHHGLPVAAFLQATPHGADLRPLLDDKRRPALRARLGQRHMRCREIAIGISRAAVENARTSASAFARAAAPHEFALIAFRALNPHRDWPCVLALRIAGAADELAEPPALLYQMVAAQRALFLERFVGLVRDARSLHQSPRSL